MISATMLDRQSRDFMERGFGEDFRAVTLSSLPSSCFPEGALACTVGDRVFFNRSISCHGREFARRVLAHELAHVVQKRRGGGTKAASASSPAPRWRVEVEAEAAAAWVGSGGRFTCVVADVPDQPRFWGPLGHYYTAYFVMLAAGVRNDMAHRLAYYTQVPDLVTELDAKWLAIHKFAESYAEFEDLADDLGVETTQLMLFYQHYRFEPAKFKAEFDREMLLRALTRWSRLKTGKLDKRAIAIMIAQRYPTLKEIQVGLHCLTGGSSADELVKRTALLKQAPWGELEFGLASHAFGDAFAHRTQQDAKRMYGGPEGHTFDSLSGDSPDEITINKAREGIYLEYAKEYFDIVKQRNEDPDAKQAKDEEWLDKHLHTILKLEPGAPGTESDGTVFRAVAFTGLNIKMHGYKPQDTAMWWSRYEASGDRMACGVPIAEPDIRRAFLIAKDWTNR